MLQAIDRPVRTTRVFTKDTLVNGTPAQIECVEIGGQCYSLSKGPLRIASLENESNEDLEDPIPVIAELKEKREAKADPLTFWQRVPDVVPRHSFHMKPEDLAVFEVTCCDHWMVISVALGDSWRFALTNWRMTHSHGTAPKALGAPLHP